MATIYDPPSIDNFEEWEDFRAELPAFMRWLKDNIVKQMRYFDDLEAGGGTISGSIGWSYVTDDNGLRPDNLADITAANPQATSWLTDEGDLATLDTVPVAKLDSDATDRMFTSSAIRTNIEAWRHASDTTKIDGADIYNGTVSSGQIDDSIWTSLIDHDTIVNNHNLTTDIDHDTLTNYAANEHIDWTTTASGIILDLSAGAVFKPRIVTAATIPTPTQEELLVWRDTDDNSIRLVYNDTVSGTVSVQLT